MVNQGMTVSTIVGRRQNRANAWSIPCRVHGYRLDRSMCMGRSHDKGAQCALGSKVVGITPLALDKPDVFQPWQRSVELNFHQLIPPERISPPSRSTPPVSNRTGQRGPKAAKRYIIRISSSIFNYTFPELAALSSAISAGLGANNGKAGRCH
jgi:hypothetical protein